MSCQWTILFENVASPLDFCQFLTATVFFRKNGGNAEVCGNDVRCTFDQDLSKEQLYKACSQSFKKSGAYGKHTVLNVAASPASPAPASSAAPARDRSRSPRPSSALAVRSSVADIKAMSEGLTAVECRSLAVYFALRGLPSADTETTALLSAKSAAAQVFLCPASTWDEGLQPCYEKQYQPRYMKCECACGCVTVSAAGIQGCLKCGRLCCAQCHPKADATKTSFPDDRRGVCHHCLKRGKSAVPLPPPPPPSKNAGIDWYFNHPQDQPWLPTNRDTSLDPQLIEITDVYKDGKTLENESRRVLPFGWEEHLTVQCVLADGRGGSRTCSIGMRGFLMNSTWQKHHTISYVKQWLPAHLDYMGWVLRPRGAPVRPMRREDLPPWEGRPRAMESTVRIEELPDEDADVVQLRRMEAEVPEEEGEDETLRQMVEEMSSGTRQMSLQQLMQRRDALRSRGVL